MYTSHFWHQYYLHRKKIIVICFISLLASLQSHAQRKSLYAVFQADYDERPLHYGFFLAGNSTRFNHNYSEAFNTGTDSAFAITPKGAPGFGLGFIASYGISKYFDIRILPSAAFYERSINYHFVKGSTNTQRIESTFLELPVLIKYKSVRRGNVRMYMVGGVKPSIEIGSNKKERTKDRLVTENMDLSMEYGIGFDLFYTFVKVSPELRFSHGIRNMLVKDTSPYSKGLDKLSSHTISLYLFFE
jgi:hypothetical protein